MTFAQPSSRQQLWIGRGLTALVVIFLLVDGLVGMFASQRMDAAMRETGFAMHLAFPLGAIVLICAIVYAIPRTATIGAILVTGFLGGAICAHFRLGEIGSPPQIVSLVVGVATWAGLFLRFPGLRAYLSARQGPT